MKFSFKKFLKQGMSLALSLVMVYTLFVPGFAAEDEFEKYLGEVSSLTEGLSLEEGVFKNNEQLTLDFVSAADINDCFGSAGWRVLVKLNASEYLTDGMLAQAKFAVPGESGWVDSGLICESELFNAEEKSFVMALDVKLADLEKEVISSAFAFDWDNNGFEQTIQTVGISLDTSKLKLVHSAGCSESLDSIRIDPTCTQVGYTEESHCSSCGLPVKVKTEIEPLGHDFTEKVINDSHFKQKAEDGSSVYYYNCAREGCDVISTEDTYSVYDSDFTPPVATAEGITEGLTVSVDEKSNITVTNEAEITLDFSLKDESIGRYMDAWWTGVKINAPEDISAQELADVKYRSYGKDGWSQDKSFWQNKDSAEDAEVHYITVWVPVTPELIANDDDGLLTVKYSFDWDKNGFGVTAQEITVKLDTAKIKLVHSSGCTETVDKEALEPTCLDGGYTKQSHCSVCGLVLSVSEPVEALGHDFSEKILDEEHLIERATCAHYDLYRYSCIRCDVMSGNDVNYEDTEGSEKLPHEVVRRTDELHLVSPADCENPAVYKMGCKNCEIAFDETFTDGTPLYHSWKIEKLTKKATISADGAVNFYCSDCGACDDSPIPIARIASVKLSGTSFAYTGKAITPAVTVQDSKGVTLKNGRDYTVTYINKDIPGTASAKIAFMGNYEGTYTAKYNIEIPKPSKVVFTSNNSTIKITWSAVPNATAYRVYYKTANGWKSLGNTKATSATFKNLPAGQNYTFAVMAGVIKGGKTYMSKTYATVDTVTTSAAPAKIVAAQNTSAIKLTWSKVASADGYAVLLKTQSGWKLLGHTKNTTATFSGLASGTNYIYAVRSVNLTASGEIIYGGYIQLTTATKPVAPTVSVTTSGGTATVRWTAVQGASGYEIYYKSATSGYQLIGTVGAGVTSFSDSGYKSGSKYAFSVRAKKAVQGGYIYGSASVKTVTMN